MSYGGELATDYNYTNSAEYIIEVPVIMDGKEVARVSAPYTQAELNRRETRNSRKLGKV
jgi:phage-related protein